MPEEDAYCGVCGAEPLASNIPCMNRGNHHAAPPTSKSAVQRPETEVLLVVIGGVLVTVGIVMIRYGQYTPGFGAQVMFPAIILVTLLGLALCVLWVSHFLKRMHTP